MERGVPIDLEPGFHEIELINGKGVVVHIPETSDYRELRDSYIL